MHIWIVLLSFLTTPAPLAESMMPGLEDDAPIRYRGIEQLLAKFDAEAEAESR